MRIKSQIMDETMLRRSVMRIAHEITETNKGTEGLVLIGIRRRGKVLAEMIRDGIEKIEGVRVPCTDLDISFYRDDLTRLSDQPVLKKAQLPFPVEGKRVVIADDVLYTGRTARAAIEAVFDCGRPDCIMLAILIDRGHRELPIRPDFVGKNIPTSRSETIRVLLPPFDESTGVLLCDRD